MAIRSASTLADSILALDSRHLLSDPTPNLPLLLFPLNPRSPSSHFPTQNPTHTQTEKLTAMNVLDSPLEALAFNYATFGFFTLVNNLWTWVAVLTAAVSFWKIRAKPHLPTPLSCNDRTSNGSPTTEPLPEVSTSDDDTERAVELEPFVPGTNTVPGAGDVDGVTKGKFTMYYVDDGACERSEEEEEATETESDNGGVSEWWERWEKVLRMRMGENEWYKYQDLTELNGNVVRLWGEAGFGSTFPKEVRYSTSSCIVAW